MQQQNKRITLLFLERRGRIQWWTKQKFWKNRTIALDLCGGIDVWQKFRFSWNPNVSHDCRLLNYLFLFKLEPLKHMWTLKHKELFILTFIHFGDGVGNVHMSNLNCWFIVYKVHYGYIARCLIYIYIFKGSTC